MASVRFLFVGLVAWLVATTPAPAAVERPDPEGQPTVVSVGIYLIDLISVQDTNQVATLDFVLWARWHDPRLAGEGDAARRVPLASIWTPRVMIANERRLFLKLPEVADVAPDGTVTTVQRLFGEVSVRTDLREFPFDRQAIGVHVISGGYTPEEVRVEMEPSRTGRSDRVSVPNWQVEPLQATPRPFPYAADGRTFSGVAFEVPARRFLGYYVWKLVFPLIIVVLMSWTVFWIDPTNPAPQISVAVTSILTLIAYQFVMARQVPTLPYLTRLDWFTLGATFLVFLALLEVVLTGSLAGRGQTDRALRIDRWARLVFPIGLVLVLVVAFLI